MSTNNLNSSSNSTNILTIIMTVAFLAGLGMGITALSAPLGVWVDAWDFRKGFSLLQFTNTWGHWVAIGIIAITAVIMIVANITKSQGKVKFATLGLLGTLFAALAFYVPESFKPAENVNIPPIHDITTDTNNPVEFIEVVKLRGDRANTVVYGGSPKMTPEKLAELQTAAYPDIKPQTYSESPDVIFDRAVKAAQALNWEIVNQNKEMGIIEATDTTFWFRFKDDVVIKITQDNGNTTLNARSLSRVGVGDVGKNAARLREFFKKMK